MSEVDISKNGPYLIKGLQKLKNSKGEELETKEVTALCRCGASENKPYCDGSHVKKEFKDDKN